jgi:hypothetical protein
MEEPLLQQLYTGNEICHRASPALLLLPSQEPACTAARLSISHLHGSPLPDRPLAGTKAAVRLDNNSLSQPITPRPLFPILIGFSSIR